MKGAQSLVRIGTFLLFCFYNFQSIEAQIDPRSKEFEASIDSIFADKVGMESPGAALIIMKGSDILLSKSYGSANLSFGVPFNENTIFPLANLTDQLVAFSALQLEKRGLIKQTDPVNKYLPEFGFEDDILISHLLNHSSDLPFLLSLRLMAGWKFSDPFYQNDFINLTKEFTKDLKPDTSYGHSHAGIKILQMLIEKVSGKDFSEYASANIFKPLGMNSSFIKNEHSKENKNNSIGYDKTDAGFQRTYPIELAIICPMAYSTQNDFEKWMLNVRTKKFEGSIIEQMDQALSMKGVSQERLNASYCLGQQQYYKFLGEDEFYFIDTDEGHSWTWRRLPKSDLSVMAITNLNSSISNKVKSILNLLLPPVSTSSAIEETKSSSIKMSEKEMEAYTGFYWDRDYLFTTQISIKNGGLHYDNFDNGWSFPLTPRTKSLFGTPSVVTVEITNLDGQGQPLLTLTLPDGSKYYSDKYDPAALKSNDHSKFTGIYSSDQLNSFYQVIEEDNKLILKRSRKPDLELTSIGKNKFRTEEIDFRMIEFVENNKHSVYQMNLSTVAQKNVEFRKR